MSVAFTKEGDLESTAADLPDRPISPHPNLVTAAGLALAFAEMLGTYFWVAVGSALGGMARLNLVISPNPFGIGKPLRIVFCRGDPFLGFLHSTLSLACATASLRTLACPCGDS